MPLPECGKGTEPHATPLDADMSAEFERLVLPPDKLANQMRSMLAASTEAATRGVHGTLRPHVPALIPEPEAEGGLDDDGVAHEDIELMYKGLYWDTFSPEDYQAQFVEAPGAPGGDRLIESKLTAGPSSTTSSHVPDLTALIRGIRQGMKHSRRDSKSIRIDAKRLILAIQPISNRFESVPFRDVPIRESISNRFGPLNRPRDTFRTL